MKGYSILRLECNPSLNGFSQITACSPIKSVSHSTLPTVSVSRPVCVCDLSMTVNLLRQISVGTSRAEGLAER